VTLRIRSWCGRLIRAATLVAITTLIPLPAAASDTASTPSPPTIKASMKKIVAREVTATSPRKDVARDDRQASSAGSTPGFFKTKPGIIALVVMAAGTGYALYSAQNDRIHSAGKE
jgi:hypothetical protein